MGMPNDAETMMTDAHAEAVRALSAKAHVMAAQDVAQNAVVRSHSTLPDKNRAIYISFVLVGFLPFD